MFTLLKSHWKEQQSSGDSPRACTIRSSQRLTHNRPCVLGAWREVIVSACPNNIRCRECRQEGHKRGDPVCEAVSVWGPQGSDRQQGDTGVTIARGTQQEPSDNEAASDDEDQWEDSQPAIDDTQSEQPSQRVTVRQQSVTRKTKVSGKKQALDSKKKKPNNNNNKKPRTCAQRQTVGKSACKTDKVGL